jgi:hypothetical protein
MNHTISCDAITWDKSDHSNLCTEKASRFFIADTNEEASRFFAGIDLTDPSFIVKGIYIRCRCELHPLVYASFYKEITIEEVLCFEIMRS